VAAVLGVSAHYHDAAAALVVDGVVIAAIQEERLSRQKNDPSFPARAIDACLRIAGIEGRALDSVAYYESPYAKIERVLVELVRGFPFTWRQFPRAISGQLTEKLWVLDRLAAHCGVPRRCVTFRRHHESHAASAFFVSPFEHAAVLTIDGVGEETTTAMWEGRGSLLTCRSTQAFPHSLGLLYAALTAWLGFEVNEGEYKVMGLAAYGEPRFREVIEKLVILDGDGGFTLALPYFAHHRDPDLPFSSRLEDLLGPRRRPGLAWNLESSADRRRADVAASLQAVLEDALLALARRAKREVGASALCLAGGVALNAVANGRLLRDSGFERVFVQPAAGDAGGALGAAILAGLDAGDPRPQPMRSSAWGVPLDAARGASVARALGLEVRTASEPALEIAERIARGELVASCWGRFEWGPRALGQRSLLADPREPATRQRINRRVKGREPFRPFAPAVSARAFEWFEGAPNDMTPFMTSVCAVRDEAHEELGAVTHVDGSARVQTVHEAGALLSVLDALERGGRSPAVLNTSLNAAGEPIAGSSEDALAFFLSHDVDALYLEDVVVERP